MPFFSVVVPSYENGALLPACLDSVRAQTLADWECIVVVDGSSDDSADVARLFAKDDARFSVEVKPQNEGLHHARRTGTELSRGDYLIYLDADDALVAPDVLERLRAELTAAPCDILRFGLVAEPSRGTPEQSARGFTAWSNAESGRVTGERACSLAFVEPLDRSIPWHMTHRIFTSSLAKRAFSLMSRERLERAEDAYEYLVCASLAETERECCEVQGYLYRMGAGITNVSTLSPENFAREAQGLRACYEAAQTWAESFDAFDLTPAARGLRSRLIEAICVTWNDRIAPENREQAAQIMAETVGYAATACEMYRTVRYHAGAGEWSFGTDEQRAYIERIRGIADRLAQNAEPGPSKDHMELMKRKADAAMSTSINRDLLDRMAQEPLRIFVSAHKEVELFDSDILQPIQVGAARASRRFSHMIQDDQGENISELNPLYCELTAQYWAWKNVDAPYVGFCHYRRYFNFADERFPESDWGEVMEERIDARTQKRYGLDDESIRKAVEGYDVITTEVKDLRSLPGMAFTPLAQYSAAPYLHDDDLIRALAILEDLHPEYRQDVSEFANGNHSCFCNMYIMRKELFDDYCAWLFPILERFVQTTDMSRYSREALRTPGHLSERLFNIYLHHHQRNGAGWKTKQVQCVRIIDPEPSCALDELDLDRTHGLPVVPCVFAADGNYVPMLTTTIYSMMRNASSTRHYDVVVMARQISGDQQDQMARFFRRFPNMSLRFLDVSRLVESYELTTNNEHIGAETYYRFLIQDALPFYDKVLYLDSDLIIEGDVAHLFDTDLGDSLIGAVRDIDFLGNLNMPDGIRLNYAREVLRMAEPYDYFQAGVLLLNTAGLRDHVSVQKWLDLASDPKYIYNDQDILNEYCQGRVQYLDPSWNVMNDCGGRIGNVFTFAPNDVFTEFTKARANERVIHYAGFQKPWNTSHCDRQERYWLYARDTPFYENLIMRLFEVDGTAERHAKLDLKNRIYDSLGPLAPIYSKSKRYALYYVRKARG
ncbi:DUF4422 domain-containing protein [Eggerthellaceae bacterium zg-997]|nr:DUF4422 domain-containing protein [Eggerthellaceae bacterium zg-997]